MRNTLTARVLYRLVCNSCINDDEKKLLMFAMISQICMHILDDDDSIVHKEDNTTLSESLLGLTLDVIKTQEFKGIRMNVKEDKLCTKEDFTNKMNEFFTTQQAREGQQQNNDKYIADNSFCYVCITNLTDCWNSIKSCCCC